MISFKIALLGIGLCLTTSAAQAFVFLPESRHDQNLTYANFTEEQTGALKLSGRGMWITIGGSVTLAEMEDWKWKPQLVVTGLAKSWMDFGQGQTTLLPQSIDAHFGGSVDLELNKNEHVSVGIYHLSGHATDETVDKTLAKGNVGNEYVFIRYMRDFENSKGDPFIRAGATFKPVLGSDPTTNRFAADQFIEYYPFGGSRNPHKGTFYTAFSVEESGMVVIQGSYNAQLGYAFGDHFASEGEVHKTQCARLIAGYYTGQDPRLKYYELRQGRANFYYAGVMVNL
jgi:hypothetical protein